MQCRFAVGWFTNKKRKRYVCEQFDTEEEANKKFMQLKTINKIPENRIHFYSIK